MTNIYLMDSREEAIVDFVKDHKEFYDKTNQHVEDKARVSLGEVCQQWQAVCQGVQEAPSCHLQSSPSKGFC